MSEPIVGIYPGPGCALDRVFQQTLEGCKFKPTSTGHFTNVLVKNLSERFAIFRDVAAQDVWVEAALRDTAAQGVSRSVLAATIQRDECYC